MGNTTSVGEKIYRAAKANDVTELQGLCMDMHRNGALDSSTRNNWLNWTDLEGRTALQWVAQKNFLQVAQILLEEGVDVHKIAPKRPSGGSALAEAIAQKHEAMVDLLLRYGADPFTENPSGKTPLDIALEMRCVAIVRNLERSALFTGYVNMKVLQLKGFSHAAKDRWVVVAPRYMPPAVRGSAVGVVRMMMLIFRNAAEAEPRTKVWLDGATICRMGQEAVLRLHPNHEQPRNAFTKYDRGWLLFFKPFQAGAASLPPPPPGANGLSYPASAAAGAAATFAAFMVICNRPLDQLQQQQQCRNSSQPPVDAGSNLLTVANPWQQQQPVQQGPSGIIASWPAAHLVHNSNPFAGNTGGSSSGTPTHAQQQNPSTLQQHYYHAGVQLQPAAAPPAAAQGPAGGQVDAFALQAAPGETDQEFAQRLALLFGSRSESSEAPATAGTAATSGGSTNSSSSRVGSYTAQQQQQQAGQVPVPAPSTSAPPAAGLYPAFFGSTTEASRPTSSSTPSFTAASAPPVVPGGASAAADALVFTHNPFLQDQAAAGVAPATGLTGAAASAVQAGPTGGSAASVGSDTGGDGELCVICLTNPKEVGLLHGASLHRCVCKECAGMMRVGSPCPMCRQTIERVIGVY